MRRNRIHLVLTNHGHAFCGGRCLLANKIPAAEGGNGFTAYREITLASEIAEVLKAAGFLGDEKVANGEINERMLEGAGFRIFASFRTNRTKYRYADTFYDGILRIEGRFSTGPTTLPLKTNAISFTIIIIADWKPRGWCPVDKALEKGKVCESRLS